MSNPRLVIGLVIMAAGVVITLDNLGFVDSGQYLRYWPAALILIGLLKLIERGPLGCGLSGWVWLALGSALLVWTLGYASPFKLIPLVLVLIGGRLVWQTIAPGSRPGGDRSEGFVDAIAVLGGASRVNASQSFRGGDLSAFMGGCELDLRKAAISESPAVIDVFAMWGGVEIKVPERWCVDPRVTALLGGVEDATRGGEDAGEVLRVRGVVLMGGVEIKN